MIEISTPEALLDRQSSGSVLLPTQVLEVLYKIPGITLRKWAYSGVIPALKVCGLLFFDVATIRAHLESGQARLWVNRKWQTFR